MTEQKQSRIGHRGRLVTGSLAVLGGLVLVGVFTVQTLSTQRYDGVRINLAGRQRMLTQMLAKEVLLFAKGEASGAKVRRTMQVFDVTLRALLDGGRAPMDLELRHHRRLPAMEHGPTRRQLSRVLALWSKYSSALARFLRDRDPFALNYLITRNAELLQEMDRSVVMMQERAERNFARVALVLGLTALTVLVLLAYVLARKITQLRTASARIRELETLLPMCSSCKAIRCARGDDGQPENWVPLESYLKDSVSAEVTHGLCPMCVERLYPDFRDD